MPTVRIGPRTLLINRSVIRGGFRPVNCSPPNDRGTITIRQGTGGYATDDRSRHRFTPDRSLEKRDLRKCFWKRRHYIGNCHTHPEALPKPSRVDVKNTRARFIESIRS